MKVLLRRHRRSVLVLSVFAATALVVALLGLSSAGRAKEARQERQHEAELALEARLDAERRSREILGLSATANLAGLLRRADQAWPATPETLPAIDEWITEARAFGSRLPDVERQIAELREHALPPDEEAEKEARTRASLFRNVEGLGQAVTSLRGTVERYRERGSTELAEANQAALDEMEKAHARYLSFLPVPFHASFEDHPDEPAHVASWRYQQLAHGALEVRRFTRGPHVWPNALGVWSHHLPQMEARAAWIRDALKHSTQTEEALRAWAEVGTFLQQEDQPYREAGFTESNPMYPLLPLGPDPRSGLLEFVDLLTGDPPPERDGDDWVLTPATGVIYVWLPGGEVLVGSQKDDASAPHFDAEMRADEGPVEKIELQPFLLSKYELNQAQFLRIVNENHSYHQATSKRTGGPMHPAERVDRGFARHLLQRLGASLPSEAQWEYAARAGLDQRHVSGSPEELELHANLSDQSRTRDPSTTTERMVTWNDDWPWTAPVGRFAPNGFGLHDMAGNVREWCLERYASYAAAEARPRDGYRTQAAGSRYVARGGSYVTVPSKARCAARSAVGSSQRLPDVGIRPLRYLVRGSR